MDYAAGTPVDKKVKAIMEPYFEEKFGNPSAIYKEGILAKEALHEARRKVAQVLHSKPREIIFTSGATESDNLAILGAAFASGKGHIITSRGEHPAVLEPCKYLKSRGFSVTYLGPDSDGVIKPESVKKALKKETILISISYADGETGAIQPIREISSVIKNFKFKKRRPLFHSDASQAAEYLNLDVSVLGIDLMTINGAKIYGPKGIGCLFVKNGTKIIPITYGGRQEYSLRPGTENVPGIVGFGEALKISAEGRIRESRRLVQIRDYFIDSILKNMPGVSLLGHRNQRLPNNVSISIKGLRGEEALLYLDQHGISVSTGSACETGKMETSSNLRFTLGRTTRKADVDHVLKILSRYLDKEKKVL